MSKLIEYLESIEILSQQQLYDYVDDNDIATLNNLILYIRQLIDEDYEKSSKRLIKYRIYKTSQFLYNKDKNCEIFLFYASVLLYITLHQNTSQ